MAHLVQQGVQQVLYELLGPGLLARRRFDLDLDFGRAEDGVGGFVSGIEGLSEMLDSL